MLTFSKLTSFFNFNQERTRSYIRREIISVPPSLWDDNSITDNIKCSSLMFIWNKFKSELNPSEWTDCTTSPIVKLIAYNNRPPEDQSHVALNQKEAAVTEGGKKVSKWMSLVFRVVINFPPSQEFLRRPRWIRRTSLCFYVILWHNVVQIKQNVG